MRGDEERPSVGNGESLYQPFTSHFPSCLLLHYKSFSLLLQLVKSK